MKLIFILILLVIIAVCIFAFMGKIKKIILNIKHYILIHKNNE